LIHVDFDAARKQIVVPVQIRFYPDRMLGRARTERGAPTPEQARAVIDRMIASGFRGQLRTGNLITGQLYVALDFFPNAPKAAVDWSKSPPEIPTIGGGLQELQTTIASIAAKLDKIPYEQIAGDLRQALQSLDRTLKDVDTAVARIDTEVTPELKSTLAEARRTFANAERTLATDSPLQQEMRDALREVGRAAASVRALADALERQPESLIRGRREEETQ
jgi:paraquat-inducible protein B